MRERRGRGEGAWLIRAEIRRVIIFAPCDMGSDKRYRWGGRGVGVDGRDGAHMAGKKGGGGTRRSGVY